MSTRQANQACLACSQPKPSSNFPEKDSPESLSQRVELLEQLLKNRTQTQSISSNGNEGGSLKSHSGFLIPVAGLPSNASRSHTLFPTTFFLDSKAHRPVSADQLHPNLPVPVGIMDVLISSSPLQSLCNTYWLRTHTWLPILSQKRISEKVDKFSAATDAGLALLLLCMKLVSQLPSELEHPALSPLYCLAKGSLSRMEHAGLISLQLLQSAILIAVYEMGHAIYPASYLSISHAARLGIMMGFHCKYAAQLFKDPETWTYREEERRAWWAIVILDRHVNLGVHGLPLNVSEPLKGTLLPCTESIWNSGEIGTNQPLFASSFTSTIEVGSFASACQASHVLGLVLRHRDDPNKATTDPHFRLSEAQQLHQTLLALSTYLDHQAQDCSMVGAIALCYSARLVLYDMYACNNQFSALGIRMSEEEDMQKASINGYGDVTREILNLLDDDGGLVENPFLCHCLYQTAAVFAWFIREKGDVEEVAGLRTVVGRLRGIERTWRVAGEYIRHLEADGSLKSLEE
ncbi:hypothetical protein LOCC1_G008317 [Lachnellula occidentalis]|uniref:Xylanolytic transcriptional activator regulatory domain-containing protein n=1 Tax=Lachnellula occidentalis TaxID=215460 RepID=A0A8H8RB03_9HELO|nr:hypothetical protein LOCC1_G008317 [Lachnellula occidentalis]